MIEGFFSDLIVDSAIAGAVKNGCGAGHFAASVGIRLAMTWQVFRTLLGVSRIGLFPTRERGFLASHSGPRRRREAKLASSFHRNKTLPLGVPHRQPSFRCRRFFRRVTCAVSRLASG